MTNPRCSQCLYGRNILRGRWCERLRILVEYARVAPCNPDAPKHIKYPR